MRSNMQTRSHLQLPWSDETPNTKRCQIKSHAVIAPLAYTTNSASIRFTPSQWLSSFALSCSRRWYIRSVAQLLFLVA
jgi:hypothetical protein